MYKIELIFVVFCLVNAYLIDTCKLVPSNYQSRDKRLPGDNGFKIVIGGNSTKYVPGEIYTVYLLGSRTHEKVQYFKRFLLNVQSSNDKRSPSKAGSFQLFKDSLATFNENCINTISEENDLQKTEVYVMWTAPPVGSGCVTFRAMVLENSKRWFSEAGQLTKEFCEENVLELPQHETHECCARDEAKYNLIFEGIWSNQTHAKDFPFSLWLTHFSDLIGASHVNNFSFWGEGQIATDGFRSLAEWGSIRLIREELSKKKAYVKQVFSAPGLWYPNVNTNTSARFYVDRKRHFVSLASMFGPSPDWFVGVNGLNLCLKNCSWIQNLIVDLYPWDAGTDSGITYMSPNLETIPREKMYKITTMYPEDPRAPFYDSHKNEMLPLARFYFELEKLIPKSYDFDFLQKQLSEMESASDLEEDKRFECRVSEYSNWTKCSVECGKGLRMRDRHYLMPEKAKMSGCNQQLVSKEMCAADIAECPKTDDLDTDMLLSGNDETKDEDENGICKTSGWSEWSECSEKCGIGFRMRTKTFMDRMGQKKCPHIQTSEKEKCMQPPCSETDIESIDPMCPTTDWSDWSPCSEQCGTGFRTRLRLLLVDSDLLEKCKTRVRLEQKESCNDTKACLKAKGLWNRCPNKKNRCMKKRKVGSCDSQLTRWYFNAEKLSCLSFVYSGCKGNDNNFESLEACNQVCGLLKGNSINSNVQNLTAPIDCLVSDWSDWSGCSTDCGTGIKKRFRTILVKNENGGKNCPRLLQRRKCIQNQCV